MDFSEAYPFSGPHPQFSPDGEYVAVVVEYRVLVREVDTLRVVQLYSCLDKIQSYHWSPDSKYILCALKGRPIVQIWSLDEPDWTCKIDEGPAGITSARWCPDARSILLTADFQIKATIWSLVDRKCVYMKGPKFSDKAIDFDKDGKKLVIAERHDCKDYLTVFKCDGWQPCAHFRVATDDLSDARWSPCGETIAAWDSMLYYKILLYSIKGEKLGMYSAYKDALGIKSVNWSPSGRYLSIGSYDQVCTLLDKTSWDPILYCEHSPDSVELNDVILYREVDDPKADEENDESSQPASMYRVCQSPEDLPAAKIPPLDKPDPKLGVGMQCWSPSEKYLATRNDNLSWVVWIWSVEQSQLVSVLIQRQSVKLIRWAPDNDTLAVCCGNSKVYLWSPEGSSVVHIPFSKFQIMKLVWNEQGSSLVLADNATFCIGYLLDAR